MTPERLGRALETLGTHGNVFADHASGSGWKLSLSIAGQQVMGRGPTLCDAWDSAEAKAIHDGSTAIVDWMRKARNEN